MLTKMSAYKMNYSSLEGFASLGGNALVYKPLNLPISLNTNSPSLIILSTWFQALPRHVSKYTSTYKSLYPNAAILLLSTSIPDMVYRPYSTQEKNLHPALPLLVEHQQPDKEVLFHIFSNSGAHTACQLARAYKSQTGLGLKVGALILDSAPGINTYRNITDGFIGGLPSTPVLKQLLSLFVYGLVGVITLKEVATCEDHWMEKMRKDLNQEELLKSTRGRVYIYSKGDNIVRWEDVESHAVDAENKGLGEVRKELWEKSGHVAHMFSDGEKYWNVVRSLWDSKPTFKSKL
jgi:hypothetical protein